MQLLCYSRPQAWMDQSIPVPVSLTCLDSEYQSASSQGIAQHTLDSHVKLALLYSPMICAISDVDKTPSRSQT